MQRIIKDDVGNVFEEEDEIAECFATYFEHLFSSTNGGDMEPVLNLVEPLVNAETTSMLAASFRRDEVTYALSQMHPDKASRYDGMNALFYQSFWSIIGKDVIDKIMNFLNNVDDVGVVNQTHIVLIPKKK